MRELGSSFAQVLERRRVGHYSIIALIASALTAIWFRSGLVIGYAESGLYIFNSDTWREITFYVWTDRISTGASSLGITILSLPFHSTLSLLQAIGFTPFERQVTLFFGLLAVSGTSMYYLVMGSFAGYRRDREPNVAALFASIFYILNPYSMIYVWNRNTVTMNVSYAALPLALALFARGLESKKMKYAVYTSIVLTASSSWVSIVPILLPTVMLSFLVFRIFVLRKDKKEVLSMIRYSGTLSLLWLLMNMWFVLYYATSFSGLWWGFSSNYSQRFLSGFPILDVIRLNFYFSSNGVFWPFYQTLLGEVLGVIMVASVLGGLIAIVGRGIRKEVLRIPNISDSSKMIGYYSALSISGLFLGSVALTPLKAPIGVILQPLPLSAGISNNMIGEKAIFLAAIGYSVLFGLTISFLLKKPRSLRRTKTPLLELFPRRALVSVLLLLVLVLNVWPMWTGDVFKQPYLPSSSKLPYVQVPDYYAQSSAWLSRDPGYFRVLALPLVEGGITYDWKPYAYSGSATDNVLLPKPVIMDVNDPVSNSVLSSVSYYLDSGQTINMWKLLSILSVKYIMVHEDINFTDRKTLDPSVVETALSSATIPYSNAVPVRDEFGSPITNSTQDWAVTWGTPLELIRNASITTSDPYVQYDGHADGLGNFAFGPSFTKPLNLSDARWLDMSIQTNVPGKLFIAIRDVNGSETFFDGRTTPQYVIHSPDAWSNFTLPLNSPSYKNQKFDVERIRSILVAQVGLPSDMAVDLKVKDILIDRGAIVSPVPGIQFSTRIGKLAFYEVGGTNSIVYPATSFSMANESVSVGDAVRLANYQPDHTLFVSSEFGDLSLLATVDRTLHRVPLVSAIRTNPTTWVVKVSNSGGPFILVFGQTFNPNWKLYLGEQSQFGSFNSTPLDERLHYLVNGYANAWYVDKVGDFSITIYFSPQSLVSVGITVSLLTFLVILSWFFWRNAPYSRKFLCKANHTIRNSKELVGGMLKGEGCRLNDFTTSCQQAIDSGTT